MVVAWIVGIPVFLMAGFMFIAIPLARYRIAWVRFSLARVAFTKAGAKRLAAKLRREHDMEFRVRDAWRGRWVD